MAEIDKKIAIAESKSLVNFSCYLGATNENIDEVVNVDKNKVCGIKVFLGASTGNMRVNDPKVLERIFAESPILVATHNEDEEIISANLKNVKEELGDQPIPISYHEIICNSDACYKSTSKAIDLATRYGTRLHVLHLTTAKELA